MVEALPLSAPFDPAELVAALAERRGRPIELIQLPVRAHTPCGLLVTTDRADYIGYPSATTALHQQHILLHELGHLLSGHAGTEGLSSGAVQALLPSLSDELVQRVLGRTVYTELQEQEAELFASLALHRPRRGSRL
ncbi:hypothetical protein KCMC57_up51090 [Kitasatospora sp. CMC57]|uniref:IrrE N-terminal-like domain-containing protein n=1 Tax=Kitasatospora sp. CMC57 TaxID=3231513 RepID=A0AB33K4V7_9ACTN